MNDKMGDLCNSLQAHQAAILYYQQEVGNAYYANFQAYSCYNALAKAC